MDGEYSRGREATIGPLAEILKKFPDGKGLVLGDPYLRGRTRHSATAKTRT